MLRPRKKENMEQALEEEERVSAELAMTLARGSAPKKKRKKHFTRFAVCRSRFWFVVNQLFYVV